MGEESKNETFWLFRIPSLPITKGRRTLTLEHRNFNALLFSAALFSSISCVFNFLESFGLALNLFTTFSSLLLIYLYYQSRFRNNYNLWITSITILLLLSVLWFINGGTAGSVSYIYLLTIALLIFISKREQQNLLFALFLADIIIVYIIEYFFGDLLVHPYPNKSSYYSDMIFVFLLVFFCIFFLVRFITRLYENERKMVHQQKVIIEEQNHEMLSSLRYASFIQKKIISDGNQLNQLFTDHFILFKPKDIVSGDFYWIKERGKHSIVVAADCTGHGVPAAFLSILGISIFEELIKQEGEELNAGAMLEKLRNKFIAYLQKNNSGDEYPKDGIDLAICIVDYQESTLQFSGANRILYLIRENQIAEANAHHEKEKNETHSLYSYKSTKNTIGFNYKEYPFENYVIDYYPEDSFYIFSDGYADQFNSENRKKFKIGQLKKELLKVQGLPMSAQGEYLDNLHKQWKGNTSQTDDILVIGLRM